MKNLGKLMCESLDNVNEGNNKLTDKKELFDKLELGEFVSFKDLKAGDVVRHTKLTNSLFKVIRKYQNMDTARANLGDEFDELLSNELIEDLTTGALITKSLPVCLVEYNGKELIHIYAPEKYENVETLVFLK